MNGPTTATARGISRGAFLALFLIPCAMTYFVGWFSLLFGLATGGVGYFLARILLGGLYVWMAAASFLRGAANGRRWAVVLPIFAGIFDVFLVLVPFVPSVFNVIALVVGARERAGGADVPTETGDP